MNQSPSEILKLARHKLLLNQHDFANEIGKTQCTVSRYESGDVPPSSKVIMHCMNILNTNTTTDDIEELIDRINQLRGDKHIKLRGALNSLLDSYFSSH